MKKLNVALVFGGKSGEHEVSLASVSSIYSFIDKEKYDVFTIGITKQGKWLYYKGDVENIKNGQWEKLSDDKVLINMIPTNNKDVGLYFDNGEFKNIDVIIPVLHGPYGEDGSIQGLFEISNIPYVGCRVLASSVGMDKLVCKKVFDKEGFPQVKYTYTTKWDYEKDTNGVLNNIQKSLSYPMFIKPANLGSSVGISKASNAEELKNAIEFALRYDQRIVIEQGIDAREIEVSVLGNDEIFASIPGEIIPSKDFYDYESKYLDGASKLLIPADLSEDKMREIKDIAIKAFKAIDGCGLSRIDFFVDKKDDKLYINEINTMPGFTNISMYPKLCEASGVKYSQLIDKLISLALEKHEEKSRKEV